LADYLGQFERGPLEVDGYRWSSRLWRDAVHLELPAGIENAGIENEAGAASSFGRPVRVAYADKTAEPLVKGSMYVSINPDLSDFFADNFAWITLTVAIRAGSKYASSH
jgi:hypothetical protein